MKSIITSITARLAALLFGAALFGLASQGALALTDAGTTVSNTATLQYSVGGTAQNSIDSSPTGNTTPNTVTGIPAPGTGNGVATTFLVDYKVDVLVSGGTVKDVSPGEAAALPATVVASGGAYVTFTVTNLSNATTDFLLTAADIATGANPTVVATKVPATTAGDTFDTTAASTIYLDDGNAVFDAADTAVTRITLPAAGTAGATVTIYVATDIPLGIANDLYSYISLQAQAAWGAALPAWAPGQAAPVTPGNAAAVASTAIVATTAGTTDNVGPTVDVVFADAVLAGDLTNIARDGIDLAYDAYHVLAAQISVAKLGGVFCDPINGGYAAGVSPLSIPGSLQQFAITISNAVGASTANLGTATDTLPAELTAAGTAIVGGVTAAPGTTAAACVNGGPANNTSFAYVIGTPAATGYAAPANAVGAPGGAVVPVGGAAVAGQTVTINYNVLLPTTLPGPLGARVTAGDLQPGEAITVFFNAYLQ